MDAVRPYLYIGTLRETLDLPLLQRENIGAMLQLCRRVEQPGIAVHFLNIDDGVPLDADVLREGVRFIREQKALGKTVLSACGAGISRSVTFAIATLKEEEGLPLLSAYRQIVQVRPDARPHPALWQSLCAAYGESVPLIEMVKVSRPPMPKP